MAKRRVIVSKEKYKCKSISYEDYKALKELLWWIEDNIFRFKDNEGFSRTEGKLLSLRIQGLITGQYIKNNSRELDRTKYTIEEVTNTFKYISLDIERTFRAKRFNNVEHRINYLMKIVENNIGEIRRRMEMVKAKKEEAK